MKVKKMVFVIIIAMLLATGVWICIEVLGYVKRNQALVSPGYSATDYSSDMVKTRNQQRIADVGTISSAVKQYQFSDQTLKKLGNIPNCPSVVKIGTASGSLNLSKALVDEYIVGIPKDLNEGTDEDTKYTICMNPGNTFEINAPEAEGQVIQSTK
jgi:hypothetical protein